MKNLFTLLCLFLGLTNSNSFTHNTLQFFPFQHEQIESFQQEVGKEVVLKVSAFLPKFDSVGHKILSANHDFIQQVLDNEILNHETKKNIILWSVKLAQHGDDMGSHILQQYYNLIDASL